MENPYNLKDVHTSEEYERALLASRHLLPGSKYLAMLKANYAAPMQTISAAQMASAVGYASWSAANLQYGKYAGAIAEALGHPRGTLESISGAVTPDIAILVSFPGGLITGEQVTWQLLPAVMRALENMKWVPRAEPLRAK
jgi:hypothetical protein